MTKKVLIAEDDRLLNKMYGLNLKQKGVELQFVGDGEKAIAAIDKESPDLLLLDLLMPHTDGFQVLDHIRKKKYSFPVIILSNLSQKMDRARCAALGAKDYCIKSEIDLDELSEKMAYYLK